MITDDLLYSKDLISGDLWFVIGCKNLSTSSKSLTSIRPYANPLPALRLGKYTSQIYKIHNLKNRSLYPIVRLPLSTVADRSNIKIC